MTGTLIRPARRDDAATIARLVRALSAEEGCPECPLGADDVLREGFGEPPRFRVLLAEHAGEATGYVLFYPAYDTDHAARGFYLQDLYVVPDARRRGVGRALMAALAAACEADGGCFLFWNAHRRNRAGLAFYRALGARDEKIMTLSLQPDALRRLAGADQAMPRRSAP